MTTLKIFLLLCQITAGEITHCSPPHAVKGHMYSEPRWQSEQPSWDACMKAANDRNRGKLGDGTNWRFMCMATNA